MSERTDPNRCPFCGQWNPPVGAALRRCRFCDNRFDAEQDQTVATAAPPQMSRPSIPIAKAIPVPGSAAAQSTRAARASGAYGSARAPGGSSGGSAGLTVRLPLVPVAIIAGVLLALFLLARKMGWF
ncbi:MAG: hypothetical protein KC503_21690 [Myxococcales bacterium]|nr:hypothetical protein [Myxococcales bacterium]